MWAGWESMIFWWSVSRKALTAFLSFQFRWGQHVQSTWQSLAIGWLSNQVRETKMYEHCRHTQCQDVLSARPPKKNTKWDWKQNPKTCGIFTSVKQFLLNHMPGGLPNDDRINQPPGEFLQHCAKLISYGVREPRVKRMDLKNCYNFVCLWWVHSASKFDPMTKCMPTVYLVWIKVALSWKHQHA